MGISIYDFFFLWSSFLFLLLPISISFYRFRQRVQELNVLCLFLYLILFFDGLGRILAYLSVSNLFIWHIYTPIEFYFYGFIFSTSLVPPLRRSFFVALLVVFTSIALSNVLFFQGFSQFNSYTRVLECMIFVCLAMVLLFKLFQQEETVPLTQLPLYWFASGVLLYFSGNVFIFIFSNFLLKYYLHLNKYVWLINALLTDVLYIFFAVALWKEGRGKTAN